MQPSGELFDEAELSEDPHVERHDSFALDIACDPNGNVVRKPRRLESRGVTKQTELWQAAAVHKLSVASKLRSIGRLDLCLPLEICHTEQSFALCTGCRKVSAFYNRCERHYCPACQPRLARERRESVEWWAKQIREPKHVVLTVRNSEVLTKLYVKTFKQCFNRLRRSKFAQSWRGGFYRLEVTNEGRGWHLHLHALIDAGWISQNGLAEAWAKIIGQDIAIVHVRDVHSRDYLSEVTKYTVKGSQLAGWEPLKIAEFIEALQGVRSFGVFGDLYGKRTEWAEWIAGIQADGHKCECGCDHFRILSEKELEWENVQRELLTRGHQATAPPQAQTEFEGMNPAAGNYASAFRHG